MSSPWDRQARHAPGGLGRTLTVGTATATRPVRVLVTGATGFLGRWVTEGFSALGDHVTTFSGRALGAASTKTGRALRRAAAEVDAVCHLAAATPLQLGRRDDLAYARCNVDATHLLLDAVAATSGCRVVFASTAMVGGLSEAATRRQSDRVTYAESKLVAEDLVERYSGQAGSGVSLRFNALGGPRTPPDRGVVAAALRAAHEDRPFDLYGSGSSGRDYLHVLDAARAVISAARRPVDGYQAIEIGSGQLSTTDAVLAAVEHATGRRVRRRHLPERADVDERPACDLRPARAMLDWTPHRSRLATLVSDQWAEQQEPGGFSARLRWALDTSGRPLTTIAPPRAGG
ncbi:NAD-dependent epimerase/dehydratase family protein [Micromonospora craniellae]|uniref:NAD-dependent epimerase/dehydratase family protein n=1 Tax=Micromonospora craniellae TaxID=2294034 RepID=UPI00131410AD|nr:NAD(P)-dependent oxidoreductase [Micromonospora craniellae]QOC91748.1 NAD(P)-dependent oxidoreductase [Micromonospora craniellae]